MSSASKSSRKGQRGRATESAKKTSPRTSASSKRSIALGPTGVVSLAEFAAAMRERRLARFERLIRRPRVTRARAK
jgi:hypothetical protein